MRNVANRGANKTNCMASKRLDFPLPLRPTTQFVVAENGKISGCCRNERKFEIVICLMCILSRVVLIGIRSVPVVNVNGRKRLSPIFRISNERRGAG